MKLLSRRDLQFLLYEWLQVETLCKRPRFAEHSRETFDAVLDLCEHIATEHFYPINRLLDEKEPVFDGENVRTPGELKPAIRAYCEAGLIAAGMDAEAGGMQLPSTLEHACNAWFNAASVGALGNVILTAPNAKTLLLHAPHDLAQQLVNPMLAGRFSGTMCLSEPQAGSSLSDIRTRAEPQADGTCRLFGNKMWISGGDHDLTENIVHLVLAKIPGADGKLIPGVKGISLFAVPKRLLGPDGRLGARNDVAVAGLNHKLGWRGTTNCLLNFGEGKYPVDGQPGAVGYLVGEPHNGLACMFHMMNDARIMIGNAAAALGYTAYLHALDYARTRTQGRLPKGKDPTTPQVRIIEHPDVRRMLLAQKCYVEGALALVLYCARLVDEQRTAPEAQDRERARLMLELLTPVAKSWPSQWCQEANSLAIQVHGGYGYTRDFNVEQYYRDQRLNPIHEGTHGIQALDLLGRKMPMEGGAAARALAARIGETLSLARQGDWSDHAAALGRWSSRIEATVRKLHGCGDLDKTLANASAFLEAFGHFVVAWIWLEQALVAQAQGAKATSESERDFYAGKQQAARYYMRWELPKIGPMLDALDALDVTVLDMSERWF